MIERSRKRTAQLPSSIIRTRHQPKASLRKKRRKRWRASTRRTRSSAILNCARGSTGAMTRTTQNSRASRSMGVRLDKGLTASNSSSSREVEEGEVISSSRLGEGAFNFREVLASPKLLIGGVLHCIMAAGVLNWAGALWLGLRTWNRNLPEGLLSKLYTYTRRNNVSSRLILSLQYHMRVHFMRSD